MEDNTELWDVMGAMGAMGETERTEAVGDMGTMGDIGDQWGQWGQWGRMVGQGRKWGHRRGTWGQTDVGQTEENGEMGR